MRRIVRSHLSVVLTLILLVGVFVGPLVAQQASRIFGTTSGGVILPVVVNTSGELVTSGGGGGDVNITEVGGNAVTTTLPVAGELSANGAAAGANRVGTLPAIVETGALPTLTDGRDSALYVDTNGSLFMRGTIGGALSNNGAAPAATNVGALTAIANASAPSWTEGRQVLLSTTLAGAQRVMITDAAGAATAIATDGTFDNAVPATGPAVGFRVDTTLPTAMADGDLVYPFADTLGRLTVRNTDPCSAGQQINVVIDIVTATTTEIINQDASNKAYICSMRLFTNAANNVAIVEDADNNCASPSGGLNGGVTAAEGYNWGANGGVVDNGAGFAIMETSAVNLNVCIITSAATQLSGTVRYVLAP